MKKLLVVLLGTVALAAYGQDGPKVVVFNSSESKEPEYWSKDNLLKFSVFEAFSGDFAFYYERLLTDNFSVEGGLGVAMSDYFSLIWNDNFDFSDETYSPLLGMSFGLGGRYYPYRAADEFYVAPEFKFRYYHNDRIYFDSLGSEASLEESRKIAIGRLTFGYVYFFDNNIFVDFSAGFGIAKVSDMTLEQTYNGTTGLFEYSLDPSSRLAPRFQLGVKIGLAF